MGSPFFSRAQAPYCHRMGAASDRVPFSRSWRHMQRPVAQLQPLVKDLPEFLDVAAGGQSHIRQVHGHNALVEPAVVLRLAVLVHIGRQEAAAAHAGDSSGPAVLVHLQLQHLLLGDVVGHHPLGGALGRQLGQVLVGRVLVDVVLLQHVDQLGERRRDPHALLVLHALIALQQRLLDDDAPGRPSPARSWPRPGT